MGVEICYRLIAEQYQHQVNLHPSPHGPYPNLYRFCKTSKRFWASLLVHFTCRTNPLGSYLPSLPASPLLPTFNQLRSKSEDSFFTVRSKQQPSPLHLLKTKTLKTIQKHFPQDRSSSVLCLFSPSRDSTCCAQNTGRVITSTVCDQLPRPVRETRDVNAVAVVAMAMGQEAEQPKHP